MRKPENVPITPRKMWWSGDIRVEPFMEPVSEAIERHLTPGSDEATDVYNRAYEAVHKAIKTYSPCPGPKEGRDET